MIDKITSDNGKNPYSVVMAVTPEQALQWLEGNTHNRSISQAHVMCMARDMKDDRWRLTHQGIAFDTDGLLIDGQHRLWAIVEANITITMRVFFNEPPENRQVLDSGQRRSNLDILQLSGQVGEVTSRNLATLRALLAGYASRPMRLSPGEEAIQYRRNKEAVEFSMRHLLTAGVQGVATSQIRAVVARAWYSADHDRLVHFCDVLKSGMTDGDNDACIPMLRDFLVMTQRAGHGESVRRLRYAKAQWTLSAYLQGKLSKRLRAAAHELFPLPEELEKTAFVA